MDLTTLSGDDTDERVRRLCAKAIRPISDNVREALRIQDLPVQVAAVCVYHLFVETARRALEGTDIRVAAVSTGFPTGLNSFEERLAEIRRSVAAGGVVDIRHRRCASPRQRQSIGRHVLDLLAGVRCQRHL